LVIPEAAESAFTRVFDALWRLSGIQNIFSCQCRFWIPALASLGRDDSSYFLRASVALIARWIASSSCARSTTGTSIILPSTEIEPRPAASASS